PLRLDDADDLERGDLVLLDDAEDVAGVRVVVVLGRRGTETVRAAAFGAQGLEDLPLGGPADREDGVRADADGADRVQEGEEEALVEVCAARKSDAGAETEQHRLERAEKK